MVLIGKIIRTRGNKGELVAVFSPGVAAPQAGSTVELKSSKRTFPQTIASISVAGDDAIIAFNGVHTIGEALRFVGCSLWADGPAPHNAADRAPGVLGFRVYDLQGECWGMVKSQPQFSLNQILEIEDAAGATVYVPWHDSLIVKIDRRSRAVVIDPPAGLRDLNK